MEEHPPELVVVWTSSYEQSNFLTGRAEGHEEAHALCKLLIAPLQLGHFFSSGICQWYRLNTSIRDSTYLSTFPFHLIDILSMLTKSSWSRIWTVLARTVFKTALFCNRTFSRWCRRDLVPSTALTSLPPTPLTDIFQMVIGFPHTGSFCFLKCLRYNVRYSWFSQYGLPIVAYLAPFQRNMVAISPKSYQSGLLLVVSFLQR